MEQSASYKAHDKFSEGALMRDSGPSKRSKFYLEKDGDLKLLNQARESAGLKPLTEKDFELTDEDVRKSIEKTKRKREARYQRNKIKQIAAVKKSQNKKKEEGR